MSPDPHIRKRVVILGGGTAGWITANAMMHSWADKKIDIILIESPAIGTVGVGEGSTPRLKLFFESIGVQESESSAVVFCDRRAFSTTLCSFERPPREVWIHKTSPASYEPLHRGAMQTYSFPEYVFIELRGMLLMISLPDC